MKSDHKILKMNVIYNLTRKQIDDLHQLYKQEWWTESRTIEETQRCVDGSQLCIGLVNDEGKLIGFARVLTDYIFKAFICDVIVAKSSRNLGFGDKIMSFIKSHPTLSTVKNFELYCLPEMFSFYKKHGFSENVGGIKLMQHANARHKTLSSPNH